MEVDPPFRSTRVNLGKEIASCLWSQVQQDNPGSIKFELWVGYGQNIIDARTWNWTEILIASFPVESKDFEFRFVWIELEEGRNLFPLEYRLSARKPFPQNHENVVHQKLEHFDDAIFTFLFFGIRVYASSWPKARSIWYSGGGFGFWSGPRYFRTKSEQDYFFRRPFWPDYFFFHNQKLHL